MQNAGASLQRFVDAQTSAYAAALAELREGQKRSHWMWFIFPQLRGLGMSEMSETYGIASLDEAKAYLAHPVIGPRLDEATRSVVAKSSNELRAVFGIVDAMKFRSSMTLIAKAGASGNLYEDKLQIFGACGRSLQMLAANER